ncbi:MAG: MoaD/ThiS family protein [Chloroflexi bacterium]|nr:MoaD/ThiS family protein [Chloroflexota bacterium]
MTQITVYPPYRALVGQETIEVDLPPGTTLRELLTLLGERYPAMRQFACAPTSEFLWGQLIVHADNEIVRLDDPIDPVAQLDLLPPIAGGAPAPRATAPHATAPHATA